MKNLTIRQPWAGLTLDGIKDEENRNYRIEPQRICIHAGLKRWQGLEAENVPASPHQAHVGSVIGTVRVVKCVRSTHSRWASPGRKWHWILDEPRPLRSPISASGRLGLGLWEFPDKRLPVRHLY